jgi:hypothetical protein
MRTRQVLLGIFVWAAACSTALTEEPPKVRLAVLIVFDQMRGDYLDRWLDLFGKDGFRRLLDEGTSFQNCHYPYAMTATGPGHASLLSGCSPQTHGIIGNNWYDRQTGARVYCASYPRYERLPPLPPEPAKPDPADDKKKEDAEEKPPPGYGAPVRLLAPTVGDVLRDASPKSKIVGLSLKDRSALLPVGQKPDACYWFDKGQFVTSTFYRDRLHAWASKFNEERTVDRWFRGQWKKLRSDIDYAEHSGPDIAAGEGKGTDQGIDFPHPFGKEKKIGKDYYAALANSPFGNQILLDFAFQAIEGEQLGQDDIPDLLTLSFSSNDLVGHTWGPDSQEVLDVTLRSDLIIRDLLAFLDAKVGKGRYVIALSADHGICPVPEKVTAAGRTAGRMKAADFQAAAEAHLRESFGRIDEKNAHWIETMNEGGIYLNQRLITARKLQVKDVAADLVQWLKQQPIVHSAYVTGELIKLPLSDEPVLRRIQKSLYEERNGEVCFVLKPYHLFSTYKTGTTHGSPHRYDTHVPLVVFGGGVRSGRRVEAITPQACAPILAKALGVAPPAKAEATLPERLYIR